MGEIAYIARHPPYCILAERLKGGLIHQHGGHLGKGRAQLGQNLEPLGIQITPIEQGATVQPVNTCQHLDAKALTEDRKGVRQGRKRQESQLVFSDEATVMAQWKRGKLRERGTDVRERKLIPLAQLFIEQAKANQRFNVAQPKASFKDGFLCCNGFRREGSIKQSPENACVRFDEFGVDRDRQFARITVRLRMCQEVGTDLEKFRPCAVLLKHVLWLLDHPFAQLRHLLTNQGYILLEGAKLLRLAKQP